MNFLRPQNLLQRYLGIKTQKTSQNILYKHKSKKSTSQISRMLLSINDK
jgi:hypothetical protein